MQIRNYTDIPFFFATISHFCAHWSLSNLLDDILRPHTLQMDQTLSPAPTKTNLRKRKLM